MKATAPDGREWRVSQHIVWPEQLRTRGLQDLEHVPGLNVSSGDGPVLAVLVVIAVTVIFVALLPFILLAVEAVVVLILTLLSFRTWIIRAQSVDGRVEEWQVRGSFRAWRAVREVARELRQGSPAAPGDDPRAV